MKKRFLIWGFAKSGRAVFKLLYNKLDTFFLFDNNATVRQKLYSEFLDYSNVFVVKKLDKKFILSLTKIIISPSISIYNHNLMLARKQGIKVVSELEEGFLHTKNKLIAITGTNGKTTTSNLIYKMLLCANRRAELVGNVGVPLCSRVKTAKKGTVFVCETSSFQLEATHSFRPKIACFLNFSADHLDRHKSMRAYFSAKKKIFQTMTKKDFAVINANLKPINTNCKTYYFSTEELNTGTQLEQNRPKKPRYGCFVKKESIVFCKKNREKKVCNLADITLQGRHNLENVLGAVCVAKILNIKNKAIVFALKNFSNEHHRLEKVFEKKGVEFFDDSKATNVASALAAAQTIASTHRTMLILGGADKGCEFDELFSNLPKNVSCVLAVGQTKDKIFAAAQRHNQQHKVFSFDTLKKAVDFACQTIKCGERLLLAPACSSFDEFENYNDRGEKFLEYIRAYYEIS